MSANEKRAANIKDAESSSSRCTLCNGKGDVPVWTKANGISSCTFRACNGCGGNVTVSRALLTESFDAVERESLERGIAAIQRLADKMPADLDAASATYWAACGQAMDALRALVPQ